MLHLLHPNRKGLLMKIDNFALDMQAKATKSTTVSTTFMDTLRIQNSNTTEEIKSIDEELEFTKRLQYELFNQLMSLLNNRGSCNRLKSLQGVDLKSNIQNLGTRTISIKEEYTSSQKLDVSMNGYVYSGSKK